MRNFLKNASNRLRNNPIKVIILTQPLHGEGLTSTSLPIGEHSRVIALHSGLYRALRGNIVDLFLLGLLIEDVVVGKLMDLVVLRILQLLPDLFVAGRIEVHVLVDVDRPVVLFDVDLAQKCCLLSKRNTRLGSLYVVGDEL